MFDHVTIRISDRDASERFCKTVLSTLGIEQTYNGPDLVEWDELSIADDGPLARHLHIGFRAASHAEVDAFWQAGIDAGYGDDAPCAASSPTTRSASAIRPRSRAFVLDPDGNNVEVVNRHR